MELAGPGDIVELTDGIYEEQLESVRDGEENNAIVVTGGIDAVIMSPSSPSVVISHSYVHLVVSILTSGYHITVIIFSSRYVPLVREGTAISHLQHPSQRTIPAWRLSGCTTILSGE